MMTRSKLNINHTPSSSTPATLGTRTGTAVLPKETSLLAAIRAVVVDIGAEIARVVVVVLAAIVVEEIVVPPMAETASLLFILARIYDKLHP